jgi:hypothetical protein
MSLPDLSAQLGLFSVDNLLAGALGEEDTYLRFARTIHPLLLAARSTLENAYCLDNGRPGAEPVTLLGVCLLQFMERCPDRQAAQMLKYHLGWKLALQLELDLKSIHPTTLVYFRQRLLEHDQARLAFDTLLQGLIKAGLVPRRGKQRLDSTHVLGLVAQMSSLELVHQTLRLALEELGRLSLSALPPFWATLCERYVQSSVDYRMECKALHRKHLEAGQDVALLVQWLDGQEDAVRQGRQVQLLIRVFAEQFEMVEGQTQGRTPPAGAVKNPHDPEAQWSCKSRDKSKVWVGYKSQVAETVGEQVCQEGEPTGSFLTAVETQEATASDEAGMRQVLQAQQESGLESPPELFVDAGYVSAGTLKEAADEGRELSGPALGSLGPGQGFKSDQFEIDLQERQATCPAGNRSSNCSRLEEQATGKVSFRFEWGVQCHDCPLRAQCVGKNQQHRTLVVGEHHEYLQRRRQEQKTGVFQRRMHQRNAIEGTISELVRGHGLRRARYRGLLKVRLQNYFIGAAANVKRWLARLRWQMKQAVRALAPQYQAMTG